MQCPACGRDNPEGFKFCGECGTQFRQERTCPACNTVNAGDLKFCGECGSSLSGGTSAPAATPALSATPLPTSFAGGRYSVRRFLGEGGRKRVYLAHDERLDRDVAVAIIKTDGLDAQGRSRVQREAQAMGRLGDHPHMVTIHDVGDDIGADGQSQPYIVSQYMAGGAVDGLELPLPVERTLEIAKGVCRGLTHAHGHGVVHRDLKPGNVWLAADGTAKIGDFGLAVALDRSRLTMAGMMVGTVAYMPPEQALGGETTPRADLYSLGCMLYEMITGRPPFVSDNPTAVISQHINTPPVAPSWLSDACPQDLEEIVLRLLAKDPAERPADAEEVLAALERVDPAEKSASHSGSNLLERLALGVFVGREHELDRLRKAFDNTVSGHGGLVMLVGEPGIGKTRTTQELETYAKIRGAQVLWGRTHESAGAPPYWPWIQAGNQYGAAHADDLATIIGPQMPPGSVSELSRIFPWLKQAANFVEPEEVADPEVAQFRLFDAYASYLRAIANQAPLVVALDDLHWADKPTLLMLQHIARELSRMRVLIVANYRDTDITRQSALSETLASLNRESGFDRIVLRGLSRDEVAAYIRARANVEPRRDVLDRIFEETEGNAFFLSEVVNLMAQEGTLTKTSISDIAIPDGVREALGRRLNRLTEETNELLQIAAIIGRDFTYDTVTLIGDRDEDSLLRMIEEALEARVIEETEQAGRYRFTHAQMQETLLAELSTTRRVRLHGQVGEALERRYGARADERATRLALHFSEAAMLSPRHAAKAVRYSRIAAQQAQAQFAWDEAQRHYEHCLALVTEASDGLGEDEAALLLAMGVCARNNGAYRAAWRALMRAIVLFRERADASGAAGATLEALLIDAPPGRQLQIAHDALRIVEGSDAYLEARLLAWVASPLIATESGAADAALARDRAHALAESHGFEDVRGYVESVDGLWANYRGEFEAAAALFRVSGERLAELGLARDAAQQMFNHAFQFVIAGEFDRAIVAAEEGLAYARHHRIRFVEQTCSDFVASIRLARCEFDALGRIVEERGTDSGYLLPLFEAIHAQTEGDDARAISALPDPSIAGGAPMYLGQLLAGRARVFWNAGLHDRARAEFDRMREAMGENPTSRTIDDLPLHSAAFPVLEEALPMLADDRFLRAALTHITTQTRGIWNLLTCPPRVAGALALHLGDVAEAERLYHEALEWCERERLPVEVGRCLQGLAEVAEHRGERAEALGLLDRAAVLFRAHGAKFYVDRVIEKKLELQGVASSDIYTSIDSVARAVERERPEITIHPAPDGTVTIMFSDIEDSTVLTERLGDQAWQQLLNEHNALIREQLKAHGGYEVKTMGDGFMVAFQSAKKGLDCAIAIQRAFAADSQPGAAVPRAGPRANRTARGGSDQGRRRLLRQERHPGIARGREGSRR